MSRACFSSFSCCSRKRDRIRRAIDDTNNTAVVNAAILSLTTAAATPTAPPTPPTPVLTMMVSFNNVNYRVDWAVASVNALEHKIRDLLQLTPGSFRVDILDDVLNEKVILREMSQLRDKAKLTVVPQQIGMVVIGVAAAAVVVIIFSVAVAFVVVVFVNL